MKLFCNVIRGKIIESRHEVSAVAIDEEGKTIFSAGNPDHITCIRSSLKPFQASASILLGATQTAGFNKKEIALMCASHNGEEIHVIDLTNTLNIEPGMIISVQDHINRTGTNILARKQKFLGFDFIDMTNIYQNQQYSIITDCCGETLNNKYEYPSHYICHITTFAHMLNISNIHGFLYNTSRKTQTQIRPKP